MALRPSTCFGASSTECSARLNPELSALEQPGKIRVVDAGSVFLEADGRIVKTQTGDFFHPTAIGYQRMNLAVRPLLDEVLAK